MELKLEGSSVLPYYLLTHVFEPGVCSFAGSWNGCIRSAGSSLEDLIAMTASLNDPLVQSLV